LQDESLLYEVTNTIFEYQSKFAKVSIVSSPQFDRLLFLDQEVQSSSSDEYIYHETLVHPILNSFAHLAAKNVLVIGGAEGGTVREVLRWSDAFVAHVDWVDIDEELYNICRQHLRYCDDAVYESPRVTFYAEDIMAFLAAEQGRERAYDVIVIDLPDPDPDHCASSDLYGDLFWRAVHRSLKCGGGLVSHAGYADPKTNSTCDGSNVGLRLIAEANKKSGFSYHTRIPCFQAEWGFWMSHEPSNKDCFPKECRLLNLEYQSAIFNWS
jgi:spermidine synthase